jgi:hypothetical protein
MLGINSGHHNLPTYEMSLKSDNVEFVWYCGGHFENFQNGRHNTAQIQHCPISTTFHMWVDYDVPNRFPTFHFENGDRLKFFDVGNQFRTLKSNNVEFVRYCGGHFENGDR